MGGCIASLGLVIVVIWLILYSRKRRQRPDRGTWYKPELPGEGTQKPELQVEGISELPGEGIQREIPANEIDNSTESPDTGL